MKKEEYDYAIIQNGSHVLYSNDSLMMIWNNLIGKNFQGEEYRMYMKNMKCHGFKEGEIQLIEKGIVKDKFVIV